MAINSWLSHPQRAKIYKLVAANCVKLLFITPELFISDFIPFFLKNKNSIRINMVCVDEAHSASILSVDYRPSYSMISECLETINSVQQSSLSDMKSFDSCVAYSEPRKSMLRANLQRVKPSPQILLLTATANKAVSEEICKKFKIDKHFKPEKIFQKNFKLNFKKVFNPNAALLDVMKTEFKSKFPVIIFCSFKKSTETITTYLQQNGYKSFSFHGGLSELQKMNTLKELDKLSKDCEGSEGMYLI